MAKQSQLDKAIAGLDAEIAVLQMARARLVFAAQHVKATVVDQKAVAPTAVTQKAVADLTKQSA